MTDHAAATVLRAYSGEAVSTRIHVVTRWRTCPFRAVADHVPRRGAILDAGCGHGLFTVYLAAQAPGRRVTGVDVDDEKLAIARRAAITAQVDDRVDFVRVEADWRPEPRWDAVVEIDMLYLLGRARTARWLGDAAAALTPGGVLVVKELDVVPSWKAGWSRFQELLATRVLRITEGEELELIPSADVIASMRVADLSASVYGLDHRRLHPHYVAVGIRADS